MGTDMEFKPVLCIYHKDCLDGIGAAWVVWRHFKNMGIEIELVAANYKDKMPDVDGKVVYVVDFSYPRPLMEDMLRRAHDVVVLDHHTSAKKNLEGLFVVDESHSGAMLAWKYFNHTPPPQGLLYVEDRDLWKFKYPETNNWVTAAFSYPFNVEQFDALMNTDPLDLIHEGKILLRKHQQDCSRVALNTRTMKCMGYEVPVVNANIFFASDLGHLLSANAPFALIYMDLPGGRKYSIRCQKDTDFDVSLIAEYFGGGGHKDASGFTIAYDDKRFARSHEVLDYTVWEKIKGTCGYMMYSLKTELKAIAGIFK